MNSKIQFNNTYNTLVPCYNQIKKTDKESYLFSLNILKDGKWDGISKLTFNIKNLDLIVFSDRPFRYAKNYRGLSPEDNIKYLY